MKYVRAIAGVVGGYLFALLMTKAAVTVLTPALVTLLVGWMFGTLGGTSIAARIGRSVIPAYVLGGFLLVAGIMNSKTFPQPAWFSVTSWLIFAVMTYVGAKLGTARLTADSPPPTA